MYRCLKRVRFILVFLPLWLFSTPSLATCPQWLNHTVGKLHSNDTVNLCDVVADRPVLIANTASHCGFTYQYGELETLHQEYKDRGLVVVGFPSNDFRQETDDEAESAKICYVNHGVTFTMTDRVHVKGSEAHPIFQHLGDTQGAPGWNFNKYLVDANGKVVKRFPSSVKPSSKLMRQYIETLL